MDGVKLTLTLKKVYALQIVNGSKQYEARLFKKSSKTMNRLREGDRIAFHWYGAERVSATIDQVLGFGSIAAMLQEIPLDHLLPGLRQDLSPFVPVAFVQQHSVTFLARHVFQDPR